MNLALWFFVFALFVGTCLVGWYIFRQRQLRTEAASVYARKLEEGALKSGTSGEAFERAWVRAHEPRSVAYMAVAVFALSVAFPLGSMLVNTVWRWFWINTPMMEAIEPGSIIQVFFGAVIVNVIAVASVAWPLMRRYQLRRPGKFETELQRELSGETQ